MEQKTFVESTNFKNLKRSISDCRVDSLLPNTLYLLNLRCNYSKKRSIDSIEFKYDENSNFNNDLWVDKVPLYEGGATNNTGDNRNNNDDSNNNNNTNSTDDNDTISDTNTTSTTDKNKTVNNVNYIKSHICFFGMEYYCLKYDLSNITNLMSLSKDSPEYSSYIINNIFLKKDPELKFDQNSLYDASWEVESLHICKRILSFIKYNLSEKENKPTTSPNTEHIDSNHTNNNTNTNDNYNTNNSYSDTSNNNTSINSNNDHCNTPHQFESLKNLRRLEDIRVLEGCCGIGGNLVHFASNFRYSLGVELNPERVEMCKNNLRVYGALDNCDVLNDNILNFCEDYLKDPEHYLKNVLKRPELYREGGVKQFDWVFISFPWGGTNYKGARDSEIYNLTDYFPNFFRVVKLVSLIANNITLHLPRSQSVLELVKSAFLSEFNYILVDSYLIYPGYHKIRVSAIHFLNSPNTFNNNINISNIIKFNNSKMFFNKLQLIGDTNNTNTSNNDHCNTLHQLDTLKVVNINYYIDKFNYLNFTNIGLLILLNEHNPNVYKKLTALLTLLPLNYVIHLVNNAIELYHSSNRPITITGNERTLGGTFFYLLKLNHNNIYKIVEKKHKIVK